MLIHAKTRYLRIFPRQTGEIFINTRNTGKYIMKTWVVVSDEVKSRVNLLRSRATANNNRMSWPELFLLQRACKILGLDMAELDMSLSYWENITILNAKGKGDMRGAGHDI